MATHPLHRPTARTRPVPDRDGEELRIEFEPALVAAATTRQEQLRGLPAAEDDPVVAAQRGALEQTLADIAAAGRRLAAGTFGTCTTCGRPIPRERLQHRPWVLACVACVSR